MLDLNINFHRIKKIHNTHTPYRVNCSQFISLIVIVAVPDNSKAGDLITCGPAGLCISGITN